MALYIAVANRKGGVGKSTVSVMLAHGLSVLGGRRVLYVDIDSQCNASVILIGGRGWRDARDQRKTISDYILDSFRTPHAQPDRYLLRDAGDVVFANKRRPALDLLAGSLLIDEVQGDLFLELMSDRQVQNSMVDLPRRLGALLRKWDSQYDVVIMDCAPGLSFVTHAAIAVADRVIVPFRPDYVSLMAIDRISLVAEGVSNLDELAAIPLSRRRYVCLPNCVRPRGPERLLIEEVELTHPLAGVQLPYRDGIANAFEWSSEARTIEQKYGDGIEDVRLLCEDVMRLTATGTGQARGYDHAGSRQAIGA